MSTKVLTAHVPLPLAEKVDQMAARLDQEEERGRLTLEALADVDSGQVIHHQSVQAWAESLDSDTHLLVPR